MSKDSITGKIIQNREKNKIQYQTSFTDFPVFVTYCKCLQREGSIPTNKINAVLGSERNRKFPSWKNNYDSHAGISLLQYKLIKKIKQEYVLDIIGEELVSLFNDNGELIGSREDFLLLAYNMITSWIQNENGYNIHPGLIILKLMIEPELQGYLTSQDVAHIFNNPDNVNDAQYDELLLQIISFRASGHIYTKDELKKTYTLLTGYVNWGIFVLDEAISSSIIKAVRLKDDFKAIVNEQMQPRGSKVLTDEEFIQLIESVDSLETKIDHYAAIYGNSGRITKTYATRISQVQDAFRDRLMNEFDSKCMMCEIVNKEMLVASHIKRDSECDTIAEKIDNNNGLLLCANHDRLFDRFLISFDGATGKIMISSHLTEEEKSICLLNPDYSLPEKYLTTDRQLYLIWHNSEFYKKENGGN